MSAPLHRNLFLPTSFLLALLAIALCAPSVRARRLTGSRLARVCEAIQILKDYDKCCRTKNPDGFAPAINVSECLDRIKKKKNICVRRLPGKALGQKTVEDKSANCTANDRILLSPKLFSSSKDSTRFIKLLTVLYHEGTHALQDLSRFTTSNYLDKVTGPLEVQAWQNNKCFNETLKGALQIVERNKRQGDPPDMGLTACQRKLVQCFLSSSRPRVSSLVRQACRLDRLSERTINGITRWLRRNCPQSRPASGSPRNRVAESRSGLKFAVTVPSDDRVLVLEDDEIGEAWAEFDLLTGLTEIFGIAWQESTGNVDHLVVTGHRDGVGTIQIWEDLTPGVLDPLSLLIDADIDVITSAPSGLVGFGPEGSPELLVWDEIQGQLFLLVDLDANGIVDAIDTTPRYRLPIPQQDYVRLTQIEDYEFTLESFAIGTLSGSAPVLRVRDLNQDGFFDPNDDATEFCPLDDPELEPGLESEAFEFSTQLYAVGPTGHDLQLWESDSEGFPLSPLGPSRTVFEDNEVLLSAPGGLAPGSFVTVVDLTTEAFAPGTPVVESFPATYRAVDNVGPGVGGTSVFQQGDLLDSLDVTDIQVNGESVPFFDVGPAGIHYVTPPNVPVPGDGISDRSHIADVKLFHQLGFSRGTEVLELQPFAYVDPLLTPEFEVRKGNVNAGVGPTENVLLVNGSPGIGNARTVFVDKSEAFGLTMLAPSSAPGGPAAYALYAWPGEPEASTVKPLPGGTGSIGKATPLQIGCPGQPVRLANNTGFAILGSETWPGPPTLPAPSTPLFVPGGVQICGTFTFQGIILDGNAPNGLAAVTNAVIVVSE